MSRPVRSANRAKVLLCYLVCFAVPPLWLYAGLRLVYPYRLVGSAPRVAQALLGVFPFLENRLAAYARLAADPAVPSAAAWAEALGHRDGQWMLFLCAALGAAWLLTLALQLGWRGLYKRPWDAAQNTFRAIRAYRLTLLWIWLCNLAFAAAVWLLGGRFVQGFGVWDGLVYFIPYALNGLAALCCFRLAAPPVLSGKRAFFIRL